MAVAALYAYREPSPPGWSLLVFVPDIGQLAPLDVVVEAYGASSWQAGLVRRVEATPVMPGTCVTWLTGVGTCLVVGRLP